MEHLQYNIEYPNGAFMYDTKNQKNIFGANYQMINKIDMMVELVGIDILLEKNKITKVLSQTEMIQYIDQMDEPNYAFYITEQQLIIGKYGTINFHSIVNQILHHKEMRTFQTKINWNVRPVVGYIAPFYKNKNISTTSKFDCIKRCDKKKLLTMTDRRNRLNNYKERSKIMKKYTYDSIDCQKLPESINSYIDQDIWIRYSDHVYIFGPDTTGRVEMEDLLGILYFISIVRLNGMVCVTLHKLTDPSAKNKIIIY